jgi:hypothetical protein
LAAVQHQLDQARRAAGVAQAGKLRDKLRLVQELEQAVAPGAAPAQGQDWAGQDWEARWNALPAVDAALDGALRSRFEGALGALAGDAAARSAHADLLARNRETVLHELLRLEIGAGIDSGPEFARERLKLQVEVLQSSLGAGNGAANGHRGKGAANGNPDGDAAGRLRALYALPALMDARTASRIDQLSLRLAKDMA